MLGSIIKYTLAGFAGAVIFATCMHVADEEALQQIKDLIAAHEAMCKAKGMAEDELKAEMVSFIHSHRGAWDQTYTFAETGRQAQLAYGAWV